MKTRCIAMVELGISSFSSTTIILLSDMLMLVHRISFSKSLNHSQIFVIRDDLKTTFQQGKIDSAEKLEQ